MENNARKLGLQINQEKTKYMMVERKNSLKQNKIGLLKIKIYKFERAASLKYLGVILNEENNHQTDLQERIKNANKTYCMLQNFFKNKNISKKLKSRLTLRLLISYIYGAPSKVKNANVVYIWTYVWQC